MVEKKKSGTATNSKNSAKTQNSPKKNVQREKVKIFIGFILLALGLFFLVAFVSFLFTSGADQSKLELNWFKLISDSEIKVENFTGKTGAWLAEIFINRWFGLSSLLFIYIFAIYGLRLLNRNIKFLLTKTIKTLLLILWISITLGYSFQFKYGIWSLSPGGTFGYNMSMWLNSLIGKVGTLIFILITMLSYVIYSFDGFIDYFKKPVKKVPEPKDDQDEDDPETPAPLKEKKKEKIVEVKKKVSPKKEEEPEEEEDFEDDMFEVRNLTRTEEPDNIPEPSIVSLIADEKEDGLEMTVEKKNVLVEEFENLPQEDYDPTLDLSHYKYPTIELLDEYAHLKSEVSDDELIENKNKIVETLKNFKIDITKIKATIGPTVTLYEIIPAQGIRISKIKNLEDDIALSLSALGIRIIAPIPGRGTIGIEVPNRNPQVVSMRSIIASKKFQETTAELPIAMGRTISNETFVFDLTKMPHILVAGATGQGKSVGLNAIITSILYKKHPSQIKFVFIDPKKVELNLYASLEHHFLAKLPDTEEPIITDVEKVKATLNSVGIEMDSRYDLLKVAGTRNIKEYNKKFIERRLNPERGHRYLPYIIVVIDEFADLIMTAGKEIELPIARIAQLARAVGIHMIIATQRPSTNIITGVIKANFPSRIAFKVASMIDSRTILDHPGANQLIGKGDMLFASGSDMVRLQCALVDTAEVENICAFISDQQAYPTAYLLPEYVADDSDAAGSVDLNHRDELFEDSARIVVRTQQGSTSMIQRKYSIGYNRAGRIMDQLEAAGIVGPAEGSKPRKVYYQDEYSLEQYLNTLQSKNNF
jgi:S-DNA-T family DNA segregation ATPase FtsK/SpoIIIE